MVLILTVFRPCASKCQQLELLCFLMRSVFLGLLNTSVEQLSFQPRHNLLAGVPLAQQVLVSEINFSVDRSEAATFQFQSSELNFKCYSYIELETRKAY